MPAADELEGAYQHCRAVVTARAKNFAYAFMLLPRRRRQALDAIYAYCRVADDFADDEGRTTEERARLLADLRTRLRRSLIPEDGAEPLAPNPELDPLLLALRDSATRYQVSHHDLDLVAIGCEQDLTIRRYETFQDLYDYCYMVASAVGLACLQVFGYSGDPDEVKAIAVDLGLAMQLTNIIRDVREDIERDRIYLPQEDLKRFGVSEEQLAEGRVDDAWRRLAAFQVERAREYFTQGAKLAAAVERGSRVCPLALASIYQALLSEIEQAGYDVFSTRVSLSRRRKLGLLGIAMGRGVLNV